MTFAWNIVFLNSMTFQAQWSPCIYNTSLGIISVVIVFTVVCSGAYLGGIVPAWLP